MAKLVPVKNKWPDDTTLKQQELCLAFSNLLLKCVGIAGKQLGQGMFDESGKHGLKMEERFWKTKDHRFYRASVGYSFEKATYSYLLEVLCPDHLGEGVYRYADWFDVAGSVFGLECTYSGDYLPSEFKHSRPDIRLSLGKGNDDKYYEVIFDLTSEKQIGHVLKKADNWLGKQYVPYIAELVWEDKDLMSL